MKRVLLFEDEPATHQWLTKHLEAAGFDVVPGRGDPGPGVANTFTDVDAVVSDVLMPDYDGFDVLRRVKAVRPDLPIVIISGFGASAEIDYVKMSQMLGAAAAFEKPIDIPVLIETLRRLIAAAEAG
ncbi:MAG: response regulator [Thalassobaculaceae bacterium]|nr:response regulator [Thalassobaculaceae bacterium]